MKMYYFKITLCGRGETADEAWEDASEAFAQDGGATPEPSEYTVEEIDDD